MNLVLLNSQSNQQFKLENDNPLIIGRGNVQGCSDRRVSRSHAKITFTMDGKVRIAALHSNPCFFTRNGVPPVLQLNKNEEEILGKGDCLGLLPDAFWFHITSGDETQIKEEDKPIVTKFEKKTDGNKSLSKTDSILSLNVESVVPKKDINCVFIKNENCLFPKNITINEMSKMKPQPSTSSAEPLQDYRRAELEKTRRLPLWMYEIDAPKQLNKSLNNFVSDSSESLVAKKANLCLDITANEKSENCPVGVEDDAVSDTPPTFKRLNKIESPDITDICGNDLSQFEGKKEEDCGSNVKDVINRSYCQYEANCYRKNAQHKLEFCHPGDADYLPYLERPLCPYGAGCYRKKKSHRVDYRHLFPNPNADTTLSSSYSSSLSSLGEERPPCLKGSSCRQQSPKHRKDFYHPPKGYTCHFSKTGDKFNDIFLNSSVLTGSESDSSLGDYDDLYEFDELFNWYYY